MLWSRQINESWLAEYKINKPTLNKLISKTVMMLKDDTNIEKDKYIMLEKHKCIQNQYIQILKHSPASLHVHYVLYDYPPFSVPVSWASMRKDLDWDVPDLGCQSSVSSIRRFLLSLRARPWVITSGWTSALLHGPNKG